MLIFLNAEIIFNATGNKSLGLNTRKPSNSSLRRLSSLKNREWKKVCIGRDYRTCDVPGSEWEIHLYGFVCNFVHVLVIIMIINKLC